MNIDKAEFKFIIAINNIQLEKYLWEIIEESKLLAWGENEINALKELTKIAGHGARYQVYNRIFFNKKIKAFDVRVPAIKARMGNRTYYCMALTPESLLKIAYVHQRSAGTNLVEISDAYQRVLSPSKVNSIRRYIDEGGFFPNSIILNFTKKFEGEERLGTKHQLENVEESEAVLINLPPYYGAAWIIDGQHRLYGYADTSEEIFKRETIPVVALVDESIESQAQIFIDINENQKKIASDLRWDLYEDLYAGSTDSSAILRYSISKIAKELNKRNPFNGSISLPSNPEGHISLTTICGRIQAEGFIDSDDGPLFSDTSSFSIEFASDRLSVLFDILAEMMPDEWQAKEKHYINTNAGIVVFLGIFRDILVNLERDEIRDISRLRNIASKFLRPIATHLKNADSNTIERYRKAGGALGASRDNQAKLTKVIAAASIPFRSRFLEKYEQQKESAYDQIVSGELLPVFRDGESATLEIKGSVFLRIDQLLKGKGIREEAIEVTDTFAKTIVAFSNSTKRSGVLIIGAIETARYSVESINTQIGICPKIGAYTIIGVEQDLKFKDYDNYELVLRERIRSRISAEVDAAIGIRFVPVEKRNLAVIRVERDLENWHYLDGDKFYIRSGNSSIELKGQEADNYKKKWKNKVE